MEDMRADLRSVLGFFGVAPEEIVGMEEIAELLGVAKVTAKRYGARDDFPPPLAVLAGGRVWRREEVLAWARRTLPLHRGGRPPRQDG
jgi:predicted DNA-binding transcriptional regulator AlpA